MDLSAGNTYRQRGKTVHRQRGKTIPSLKGDVLRALVAHTAVFLFIQWPQTAEIFLGFCICLLKFYSSLAFQALAIISSGSQWTCC